MDDKETLQKEKEELSNYIVKRSKKIFFIFFILFFISLFMTLNNSDYSSWLKISEDSYTIVKIINTIMSFVLFIGLGFLSITFMVYNKILGLIVLSIVGYAFYNIYWINEYNIFLIYVLLLISAGLSSIFSLLSFHIFYKKQQ